MSQEDVQEGFFATQIAQNNIESEHEEEHQLIKDKKDDEPSIPIQSGSKKAKPELKNLLLAFNAHDKKESGTIPIAAAKQILDENNINTQKFDIYYQICQAITPNFVTFDEFLFITCLCEDQSVEIQRKYQLMCGKIDNRLIEFLRLLNNYRKKTEGKHDYKQAKKSKAKIEEIRERQLQRRNSYLSILHQHQIQLLEEKQRAHFIDFCSNWDQFMMEYQKTAADLLEKLHQKHETQMDQFTQKTQEQLGSRIHYSKYILQMQTRQKYLVKSQKYEQALKIQQEINDLKEKQIFQKQLKDQDVVQIRCAALKKQQVSAVNSLLQNIQKDRNDQMKQRKIDSEKLIVRNKALLNEINHRHQEALKRVYEILHNLNVDERRETMHKTNQNYRK